MPLNEIEQHPYLDYFIKFHQGEAKVPWEKYTKMFIGSFPVYQITKTIYPEQAAQDRSIVSQDGVWNFFYGSKTNQFWEYLIWCFKNINPTLFAFDELTEIDLIKILEDNNILLTDIVESTNRCFIENGIQNPYSSADTALMNATANAEVRQKLKLNIRIVKWLERCRNIDSIYFTARGESGKCPTGWFYKMLNAAGVVTRIVHRYDSCVTFYFGEPINREITLFFLPTPSSSRSINMNANRPPHQMFYNYLNDMDPDFLRTIEDANFQITGDNKSKLAIARNNFIIEWWFEFVRVKNKDYNGIKG
ncbi:MAG: hypothetical protein IPP81_09220 [Chitinophagaceae bacterium]|nr:hypothetical protein [Chitinophagaceae bacterium]